MASFERLKGINAKTKDLINGYIRQCEIELFEDLINENPYYHIPPLINNYCILFYDIFTWYKKQHGDAIQLISDSEVKQIANDWSTCVFENVISGEICDKFSVTCKVVAFGDDRDGPYFCIGYATGDTLEESMKDWNDAIGGDDATTSASWGFADNELHVAALDDTFSLMDSVHINWTCGDLVKISFDFIKNKTIVYHNDKELDSQVLHSNKLWIGLSLYYKGSQMEMVQYKYDHKS